MTDFGNITPGMSFERTTVVNEALATTHTKVPVLSTPMMIQLMEFVCNDLIQKQLPDGFVTVGYEVHVRHKAPALVGAAVTTWCTLLEVAGRKLLFEVRATEGDRVIGEGQHRRAIVPL